jgi:hypothetical protein
MLITLGVKQNKMIKIIKCKWNWVLSKITFKTDDCPYKICTCKK